MERRSCSNSHFINAIKSSSVTKILNINSCGKPALVFKKLQDIFENRGSTSCTRSSPRSSFNHIKVKTESQHLPLAVRTLREVEPTNIGAHPCGKDSEIGSYSDDYIFGKMTLKELKKNCKAKKRKRVDAQCFNSSHSQIKLEPEEEDSDLKTPLITLKLKVPKAKKKCKTGSAPKPVAKPQSQIEFERPLQSQADLLSLVCVKTEVVEPEFEECQNMICTADISFSVIQNDESCVAEVTPERNHLQVECQSLESNLCGTSPQRCTINEVSFDHLEMIEPLSEVKESQNVMYSFENSFLVVQDESGVAEVMPERNCLQVECQSLESNLRDTQHQTCALNEISFNDVENINPLQVLSPNLGEIMDAKDQEKQWQQFLQSPTSEYLEEEDLSISPVEDLIAGRNGCSTSVDLYEFSVHRTNDPAVETIHIVPNESTSQEESNHASVSLELQDPASNDALLSFSKDEKAEGGQTLKSELTEKVDNSLNNGTHLDVIEDELSSCKEEQPPISSSIDVEITKRDSNSCRKALSLDEIFSSAVVPQVPERLLSTRKVVSPTSEERLCLAMNSTKSFSDMKLLDCKEDICNEEHTAIPSLCEESDKLDNVSKTLQVPVVNNKVTLISQIRRKAKHEKTSSPKGNLEGPRMSRALPGVNTGCTSIQGCSENAIAFSRRQMQDIESLAMKLMGELKSMKDIVEEKLLFEAYRNPTSKHDAEEVKNAITNASKTEEMAKKWLSMMGRDCTRFCKIMSLNQKGNNGAASGKTIQRDRKKITFADEAGGMLCHVKFFENGMTSSQSQPKP